MLQKHLGGDVGYIEDPGWVSPPGGQTDLGDKRKMCGGRDVGIPPSGGGAISSGIILHTRLHKEMTGNNHSTGGIPSHL